MNRRIGRLAGVLLVAAALSGCGSAAPDYATAETEMNHDARELTRSLAGVTIVRNDFRIDICTNDGDGPVPPSTRVELILRGSRTEGQLRSAAATELRALGYTVDGEANPEPDDGGSGVLIAGTRKLSGGRDSKLAIYLSAANTYDFILASTLSPDITC